MGNSNSMTHGPASCSEVLAKLLPKKNEEKKNPGKMEDLHKGTKEVFPTVFEGAKILFTKPLSSHFITSHTFSLSQKQDSQYSFGSRYRGTKNLGSDDVSPILTADIDPNGDFAASVFHNIGKRGRVNIQTAVTNGQFQSSLLEAIYKGDLCTSTVALVDPSFISEPKGLLLGRHLHTVTPRLTLGGELAVPLQKSWLQSPVMLASLSAKYTGRDYEMSSTIIGTTTLKCKSLQLCYSLWASEQLRFGVELYSDIQMWKTRAKVGYCVDLPQFDLTFRASVDSIWTVSGVLEKRLRPDNGLPLVFALSTAMNHPSNSLVLGVGLSLG